jgi:non-ribosomal peptide synthetase component F
MDTGLTSTRGRTMAEYSSFDVVVTELYGAMEGSSEEFLEALKDVVDPADLIALMSEYTIFMQTSLMLITDSLITARPMNKEGLH